MAEPALVANCVSAMRDAVALPVTVKHRLGIDDLDSYGHLADFVGTLAESGCETFVVHARKAWLQGLSPRKNREVPPLRHEVVYRLKRDFPALEIVINGGLLDLRQALDHLADVDGAMIGRAVYNDPWMLADADRLIFGDRNPATTRHEVLEGMHPWIEKELASGTPLQRITRHLLGLFNGQPGARRWRRHLSEHAAKKGAGVEVLDAAAACVSDIAA
jgi:tRNA-dihydrouridine synthase A